jgi:hypothetical protein
MTTHVGVLVDCADTRDSLVPIASKLLRVCETYGRQVCSAQLPTLSPLRAPTKTATLGRLAVCSSTMHGERCMEVRTPNQEFDRHAVGVVRVHCPRPQFWRQIARSTYR